MDKVLRLLPVIFVLLLFAGCSSAENAITGVFERINAADPLPKNYGETYKDAPAPSSPSRQNQYSGAGFNENRGSESSFEEWHNNQY